MTNVEIKNEGSGKNCKEVAEYIFEPDRYFNECHAATLLELPNENIIAVWFAGTVEGHPDTAIWKSIRTDGKWSEPEVLVDQEDVRHGNPVLLYEAGIVYLFYIAGQNWDHWFRKSTDGGVTFSSPQSLPDGINGPIKNKAILMSNGRWIVGSSCETEDEWYCVMETFGKDAQDWESGSPIYATDNPKGIIQPTLWESSPGNIHALVRSTMGWIYRTDSKDYGKNWTTAYRTNLLNPNSGIDLCKLDDGRLVLIYNPCSYEPEKGLEGSVRTPLMLAISNDNGQTWSYEKTLEDIEGEFSYPAIIPIENAVAVAYTWRRKTMRFHIIPLNELPG